jgi:hypothetical protein
MRETRDFVPALRLSHAPKRETIIAERGERIHSSIDDSTIKGNGIEGASPRRVLLSRSMISNTEK